MRLKHLPEADALKVNALQLVTITLLLDEIVNNVILEELSHCLSLGRALLSRLFYELFAEADVHVGIIVVLEVLLSLHLR